MFKSFFKKNDDEDIFETVDPILEQRRNEKFSKPLIYDEEFSNVDKEVVEKKKTVTKKPKENETKVVIDNDLSSMKKGYEMMEIISPMFGMKEDKKVEEKVSKKTTTKKVKRKDNSLVQVISPYYGNFNDKKEEVESESMISSVEEEKEETVGQVIEEKLPTVEDNLRNIANIVKEEQDQLKIIEERTGEFKLDFGSSKSDDKTTLIDEIDDNMSLDELMSLYEKKFKD